MARLNPAFQPKIAGMLDEELIEHYVVSICPYNHRRAQVCVSECYEDVLPGPRSFLKVFVGYDFVFYSKG